MLLKYFYLKGLEFNLVYCNLKKVSCHIPFQTMGCLFRRAFFSSVVWLHTCYLCRRRIFSSSEFVVDVKRISRPRFSSSPMQRKLASRNRFWQEACERNNFTKIRVSHPILGCYISKNSGLTKTKTDYVFIPNVLFYHCDLGDWLTYEHFTLFFCKVY